MHPANHVGHRLPQHVDVRAQPEILPVDAEGRAVLTETIKAHAGIADRVTFVGQGYKVQIWEPERFAAYREEARNRLRDLRKRLGPGQRAAAAGAAE